MTGEDGTVKAVSVSTAQQPGVEFIFDLLNGGSFIMTTTRCFFSTHRVHNKVLKVLKIQNSCPDLIGDV